MSDTPETDAQVWTSMDVETGKKKGSLGIVSADFARRLERERNAALARITVLEDTIRRLSVPVTQESR